jgi:hypothetical protein
MSRRPLETLRREEKRPGGGKGKAQHARNILQGWRGAECAATRSRIRCSSFFNPRSERAAKA